VYDYVQKDPRRALPVAAATLACFAAVIAIGFSNMEQPQQQAQTQGQMQQGPMVMPQPDWQAQHRAWKDAHDYGSSVINDAYKYRRDSQDRMDETYRRGTYDWYTDKDK
jgi:cytochrome P450